MGILPKIPCFVIHSITFLVGVLYHTLALLSSENYIFLSIFFDVGGRYEFLLRKVLTFFRRSAIILKELLMILECFMTTEEFFKELANVANTNPFIFDDLKTRVPLGIDNENRVIAAGQRESVCTHVCVTGVGRTEYIRRLALCLAGCYDQGQINFLIASPKREYAELLKLTRANVIAPLIDGLDGVWKALDFAREQANLRLNGGAEKYGKLVFVLDGLETLASGSFDGYLPFFNLAHACGVDVITGVDLLGGVFEERPQDFVGGENCLVTVTNAGKADVVYTQKNGSLTLPVAFFYPSEPSFADSLAFVNDL